MPDVLRIKRRTSGGTGAPISLLNAELAFNEVDNTLYYGKGNNAGVATSIIPIAGQGFVTGGPYLPIAGGTVTGNLTVNGSAAIGNGLTVNGIVQAQGANGSLCFLDRSGGSTTWVWYSDGGTAHLWSNVSGDVLIANYTTLQLSGALSAPKGVYVGGTGSVGEITMLPGSSSGSGYLEIFNPSGTRLGYLGLETGNPAFNTEVGAFAFRGAGGVTVDGLLSVSGNLTVNGLFVATAYATSLGKGIDATDVILEMGQGRTAAGPAYINMHASTGVLADFRLTRASGANGAASLVNVGTGSISFQAANYQMALLGTTGDLYLPSGLHVIGDLFTQGAGSTSLAYAIGSGAASIEIGDARTADGYAFIDFHSAVGTDYDLRILRGPGGNGDSIINNTGLGNLTFQAGTYSMTLQGANGNFGVGGSLAVGGNLTTQGNNTFNGGLVVNSQITSQGSGAAYYFEDRTTAGNLWSWYAISGVARLYYGVAGRDFLTVNGSTGAVTIGDALGVSNPATSFFAREESVSIGITAGSYKYPFEFSYNSGNDQRLQITGYRRTAGSDWSGTGWRIQTAVDSSFTDGSKTFLELTNTGGQGRIFLGVDGADIVTVGPNFTVNAPIYSVGGNAAQYFADRGNGNAWAWYASGGTGRLWNGASDSISVDQSSGNVTILKVLSVVGTFFTKGDSIASLSNAIATGTASLELGEARTADGGAIIDLHASVGTDFDFRIARFPGVNGNAQLQNPGTGGLYFTAGSLTANLDATTGDFVLPNDPTYPRGAATKQMVDAKLPLAGGALTGQLTINGQLTVNSQITTQGAGGILQFADRSTSTMWGWYGSANVARLWNNSVGDIFSVNSSGDVGTTRDVTVGRDVTVRGQLLVGPAAANTGYLLFTGGDANTTGYMQLYNPAGTRLGYLGYYASNPSFTAEVGAFAFRGTGGVTVDGPLKIGPSGGGQLNLVLGSASLSGYIEIYNPSGTRLGYLGGDTGNPAFTASVGAFVFHGAGGVVVEGPLRAGNAAGNATSPTITNTNLLLYNNSATNWSGIGSDTGGNMYFVTGTSAPATRMRIDITGACFNQGGTWSALSDAALKENVQPYTRGLDAILNLSPVSFVYKPGTPFASVDAPSPVRFGLLAQDVEPHIPEIVGETMVTISDKDEMVSTLNPGDLVFVLINAVKELNTQVEELRARLP